MANTPVDLRAITQLKEYIDPKSVDPKQLLEMLQETPISPVAVMIASIIAIEVFGVDIEMTDKLTGLKQSGKHPQFAVSILYEGFKSGDPLLAAQFAVTLHHGFSNLAVVSEAERRKQAGDIMNSKLPATGDLTVAQWILKEANENNSYATMIAGGIYLYGIGTKKDHIKAMHYYTEAAGKFNVIDARGALASIFNDIKMERPALKLFNEAVDGKLLSSMFDLGKIEIKNGNLDKGMMLLNAAADQNETRALELLASIYEGNLTIKGISKNKRMAILLNYTLGAEAVKVAGADKDAQVAANMGQEIAFKYYQRSMDLGSISATIKVAECLATGRGVNKDRADACALYDGLLNIRPKDAQALWDAGHVVTRIYMPMTAVEAGQVRAALTKIANQSDVEIEFLDAQDEIVDAADANAITKKYVFDDGHKDEDGEEIVKSFAVPVDEAPDRPEPPRDAPGSKAKKAHK